MLSDLEHAEWFTTTAEFTKLNIHLKTLMLINESSFTATHLTVSVVLAVKDRI